MSDSLALGIDVGGTGIKAGIVNTRTGRLAAPRRRVQTPRPGTPDAVVSAICDLTHGIDMGTLGAVGVGFPAAIKDGRALTAVNLHADWLDVRPGEAIGNALGLRVAVLNDADAAGLAEVRFGVARGVMGTVVMVTLGTGIGTSLFHDGRLIPNAELARVRIKGKEAQLRASEAARKRRGVSWEAWARDIDTYLAELQQIIWPDLVIIGGGVSAKSHFFLHHLESEIPVRPAKLLNNAGIVGAALYATEMRRQD